MKTIAVIGAGLMGRLIALSLTRQGYQVTLFDKDNQSGKQSAAYAAAGLLTPLGESMHCSAEIVEMGFAALKRWPTLLATLDKYTFFQQEGTLVVSHEQDQGDYQHFARHLEKHYHQHQAQPLTRQQLLALEPEIGRRFKQGLFLPDEGQIGNRKLLIALQYQLKVEGVNWLSECAVKNIIPTADSCQISYTIKQVNCHQEENNQQENFDLAIDCRGMGAKCQSNNIDEQHRSAALQDLRAVRGELFQLFAPEVNISRPVRLMHPRYQLYIAPKGKGFFVVGATEIESDDTSPMTVRSAMELLSAAYSVHPGFAEANIRQHVSHCRPTFNDNFPRIIAKPRLVQVNGLYRHGFLIAPIVLEQVLQLVNTFEQALVDKTHFSFSHLLPISYSKSTT